MTIHSQAQLIRAFDVQVGTGGLQWNVGLFGESDQHGKGRNSAKLGAGLALSTECAGPAGWSHGYHDSRTIRKLSIGTSSRKSSQLFLAFARSKTATPESAVNPTKSPDKPQNLTPFSSANTAVIGRIGRAEVQVLTSPGGA